jgi:MFS family permease
MAVVAPLRGLLADRYGRKIMVVRAMLGGAAIISLMAAANAVSPMIGVSLAARWGLPLVFLGSAALYGLASAVAALVLPAVEIESIPPPREDTGGVRDA